jgi:hypothetical protein
LIEAATAKDPGGVTVDEQRQQPVGRVLFAAGAADVDLDLAQVEGLHGIEDEVDEVVGRHPIAEMGCEQQRSVAINGYETGSYMVADAGRARLFKTNATNPIF